jgi:hypothetical protein
LDTNGDIGSRRFKDFFDRTKEWADLEEMNTAGTLDVGPVIGTLAIDLGGDDPRVERLRALADPERRASVPTWRRVYDRCMSSATDDAQPARVLELDRTAWALRLNIAIKVGLAISFFVAIVFVPDSVDGKAMPMRAPLFLASAVLVPVIGWRRRWSPHAHIGDLLLAAPFLLDTLGNLFGLYDEYPATDDVLHALNWILLVGAFHAFRFRKVDDRRDAVLLGYGFGAIAIVWWEVLEWLVSTDGIGGADGLSLTYGDTVGDLLLSSTGGLLGSVLAVALLGPKRA